MTEFSDQGPPCPPGTNDPVFTDQAARLARKTAKETFRTAAEQAHVKCVCQPMCLSLPMSLCSSLYV